jgi:hypothetical protein
MAGVPRSWLRGPRLLERSLRDVERLDRSVPGRLGRRGEPNRESNSELDVEPDLEPGVGLLTGCIAGILGGGGSEGGCGRPA